MLTLHLARIPVSPAEEVVDDVFQTTYLEELPIKACDIKDVTRVNPVLSNVTYKSHWWPQSMKDLPDDLQPYFQRKNELTIDQGFIL